jgi:uncharacterized membrane protein
MTSSFVDRMITTMSWLDPPADALQQGISRVVESGAAQGQAVMNVLHGTWLGHPLHPALVSLPLGAWTTTLALDLAGLKKGADLSLAFAAAGAAVAALAGTADWSKTDGMDRRLGLLHAALNSAGLTLTLASLGCRLAGARKAGVGLSLAAFSLANVAGYLGGELSYTRGVGVNHAAWDQLPETFTSVISADQLQENTPRPR